MNPVLDTIFQRRHVGALGLTQPGPDEGQLGRMLDAALAAPDHGKLVPFRFVIIPEEGRDAFAELSEAAIREAIPDMEPQGIRKAREKALTAPATVIMVARFQPDHPKIGMSDQWLTIGCALQNLWLAAESMGFGCGISSGRLLETHAMRLAFALGTTESLVATIAIGTPRERIPARTKPAAADYVSRWS